MTLRRSSRLLSFCIALSSIATSYGFSAQSTSSRRAVLEQLGKLTFTPFVTLLPPGTSSANAVETTPISASWTAVDGLNSLESEKKIVGFDKSAYQAMVNDKSRTPLFEQAIANRLKSAEGGPESQVVLDLGTGPYALFAVIAAKNGAGKVYAIEASKEAAASAREIVKKNGFQDKITILEGLINFIIITVVQSQISRVGQHI